MRLTCKGICTRLKAAKPLHHKSRYASGQKRCQICSVFIEWNGLWCPCCSFRLRCLPRSPKYKAAMSKTVHVPDTNKNIAVINDDGSVTYMNNVDEQELTVE